MSKKALTLESAVVILVLAAIVGVLLYTSSRPHTPENTADTARNTTNTPSPKSPTPATTSVPAATPMPTMNVSGCKAVPASVTTKLGGIVKFENKDAKAHVISFGPKISFVVSAQSVKQVTFDFDVYPGSRQFACDGKPSVGTIVMTK